MMLETSSLMALFPVLIVAYGLGSIPVGYLVVYAIKGIDIRSRGSGNIGAANVFRVIGAGPACIVGLLDVLKGWGILVLVSLWHPGFPDWGNVAAGLVVIAGHNWPVWLKFRGGKGVLTSAGVFMYLAWLPLVGAATGFFLALVLTGYISVGSLVAATALPLLVMVLPGTWNGPVIQFTAITAAVMVWLQHRSNIRRLLAGREGRISIGGLHIRRAVRVQRRSRR